MKKQNYIVHNLSLYGIDLKRLERETLKILFLGIVIAVLFHGVLIFIFPVGEKKVADKNSVQVDLVKIPPRIMMPRPAIISKNKTHEIYRFRKKSGAAGVTFSPKGLKNPSGIDYGDIKMQTVTPEISEGKTTGALSDSILAMEILLRMPDNKIPFSSDLFVDKGDLQSSKSMIIIPPGDKMAIQGYTHIASVFGEEVAPQDTLLHAFEALANAVKYYTNIDAKCDNIWLYKPPQKVLSNNNHDKISNAVGSDESFKASDESLKKYEYSPTQELTKYPVIYLSYDKPFKLTEDERLTLAGYICSGGFIIIDNPLPETDRGRVGNSLKNAILNAFYNVGVVSYSDYIPLKEKKYAKKYKSVGIIPSRSIRPISKDHDLFHCFFDFDNGSPNGYRDGSDVSGDIKGIYLGERLIGLYLNGYGLSWNNKRNEQQLKMGVNMIVYALKHGYGRYNYFSGEMVRYDRNNPVRVWGDTLSDDSKWFDIEETIR